MDKKLIGCVEGDMGKVLSILMETGDIEIEGHDLGSTQLFKFEVYLFRESLKSRKRYEIGKTCTDESSKQEHALLNYRREALDYLFKALGVKVIKEAELTLGKGLGDFRGIFEI